MASLDTTTFRNFASRRALWIECLSGKDRNSIIQQTYRMIWDAAAFRVVNEARKIASADVETGLKVSGLLHGLLDRSFFAAQMSAIRRITDPSSPFEGKKGVWSLTALLKDMATHTHLFTREHLLEASGHVYDYIEIERRFTEWLATSHDCEYIPAELVSDHSSDRHKQIDVLLISV